MLNWFRAMMRIYSYLYHGVLALFLLGVAALALLSGSKNLQLGILPWTGLQLAYWLLGSALFGLLSIVLAITGKLRALFFIWALAVLVMMVRGFFWSSYVFADKDGFRNGLLLTAGAVLAILGAWYQLRKSTAGARLG